MHQMEMRSQYGSYEILGAGQGNPVLLGEGSIGRTFEAVDTKRPSNLESFESVALRVIHPRLFETAAHRTEFCARINELAKIKSQRLVSYVFSGEQGEEAYYVTRLYHGGGLDKLCATYGPLPEQLVVLIGLHIVLGLRELHGGSGFVHRNIKPSNVMFMKKLAHGISREELASQMFSNPLDSPLCAIADWGVASAIADSSRGQQFLGSPLFASPEQICGLALTHRSDIYSLAMTLWFLLQGKGPFLNENGTEVAQVSEAIDRHMGPTLHDAAFPSSLGPNFRAVLSKMAAKDSGARYASLEALEAALRDCLQHGQEERTAPMTVEYLRGDISELYELDGALKRLPGCVRYFARSKANGVRVVLSVFSLELFPPSVFDSLCDALLELAALSREPAYPKGLLPVQSVLRGADMLVCVESVGDEVGFDEFAVVEKGGRKAQMILESFRSAATALEYLRRSGCAHLLLRVDDLLVDKGGLLRVSAGPQRDKAAESSVAEIRFSALCAFEFAIGHSSMDGEDSVSMSYSLAGSITLSSYFERDIVPGFVRLLYQAVSGREVPGACTFTGNAYPPLLELCQSTNNFFRDILCRQIQEKDILDVYNVICGWEKVNQVERIKPVTSAHLWTRAATGRELAGGDGGKRQVSAGTPQWGTKTHYGPYVIATNASNAPILLGRGSFGRIYQASCKRSVGGSEYSEQVAVKVFDPALFRTPADRVEFLKGLRNFARFHHSNLIQHLDCGEEDGELYQVMQLCRGGSLSSVVARLGPMPEAVARLVAFQVASGLRELHETHKLIHRDIKPSNIMFSTEIPKEWNWPVIEANLRRDESMCRIVDFGLAEIIDTSGKSSSRFAGSPLYASPEQIREEPMNVRSDIYSLGMTLWFLLQGKGPFLDRAGKPLVEMRDAIVRHTRLEEHWNYLPAGLSGHFRAALVGMLAKAPERRFETAAEVRSAFLERVALADHPKESGAGTNEHIERLDGALEQHFQIKRKLHSQVMHSLYDAVEIKTGRSIRLTLIDSVVVDGGAFNAAEYALKAAAISRREDAPGSIVGIERVLHIGEKVCCVEPTISATSLGTVLRGRAQTSQRVPAITAMRLLTPLAAGLDFLVQNGQEYVILDPEAIWLCPQDTAGKFVSDPIQGVSLDSLQLCVSMICPPIVQVMEEPADHTRSNGSTVSPSHCTRATAGIARLLYRMMNGSDVPAAAFLSNTRFPPLIGLSSASNNLLANILCQSRVTHTPGSFLEEICKHEGIPLKRLADGPKQAKDERATPRVAQASGIATGSRANDSRFALIRNGAFALACAAMATLGITIVAKQHGGASASSAVTQTVQDPSGPEQESRHVGKLPQAVSSIPEKTRVLVPTNRGDSTPVPMLGSKDARQIINRQYGFTFTVPMGYIVKDQSDPTVLYQLGHAEPTADSGEGLILVHPMHSRIGRNLTPGEVDLAKMQTLEVLSWHGRRVDSIREMTRLKDQRYVWFNVRVPFEKAGVVFSFGDLASQEASVRRLVEKTLDSIQQTEFERTGP